MLYTSRAKMEHRDPGLIGLNCNNKNNGLHGPSRVTVNNLFSIFSLNMWCVLIALLLTLVQGSPIPQEGCCMPAPGCTTMCSLLMPVPPPPCCMPGPDCMNPCAISSGSTMIQSQSAPPLGFSKKPGKVPIVYAPLPGEIVFKLLQNWDSSLLDNQSPSFQILEGNIRSAVQSVIGPQTQVTNVYFREGYVPGNPPSRPKTVAHMMVNGGSDAASMLENSVAMDGTLGDGLKVYRDSFNAY